jgi:tRNA threonylcarbamoyladenosine biosynthesis protein TsaE
MEKGNKKFLTKSAKETQKIGADFALRLGSGQVKRKSAIVIGLEGDLGSGKTTFLQGFAKGLGIKEKILSPTFVIMKRFKMSGGKNFIHIDTYRINQPEEILEIGFEDIIGNPKNIVAVEWPEKIKKYLPEDAIIIKFKFIEKEKREIIFI